MLTGFFFLSFSLNVFFCCKIHEFHGRDMKSAYISERTCITSCWCAVSASANKKNSRLLLLFSICTQFPINNENLKIERSTSVRFFVVAVVQNFTFSLSVHTFWSIFGFGLIERPIIIKMPIRHRNRMKSK